MLTGITIEWDKGLRVYVTLQTQHMGKVCGLCGNYDKQAENDFRARTGQVCVPFFQIKQKCSSQHLSCENI